MYASHIQFFFRNGFFKKFNKFELDIVNTLCLLQKTEKSIYNFTKVQKNYFIFFFLVQLHIFNSMLKSTKKNNALIFIKKKLKKKRKGLILKLSNLFFNATPVLAGVNSDYLVNTHIFCIKKKKQESSSEEETTSSDIDTFNRQPIYYKGNRFAVIGPDDDVIWPSYSKAMDFELELACYIGRKGRDIPRDKARDYILGYTIFNDMSARDAQAIEMVGMLGPAKSKDFDTGNVMGPCLVTADEIGDPYDLNMIARVNGEEWGRGNTRDMRWQFEDLIAHISRSETLYPGEVLGSGTVGNGCGLEQLRFLKPDDVIELEIDGIGILRTRVTKPVV